MKTELTPLLAHTRPVPDRRLFPLSKAAKYLGVSRTTLEKYTDLGTLQAFDFMGRRVYKLGDLDAVIEALPKWQRKGTSK